MPIIVIVVVNYAIIILVIVVTTTRALFTFLESYNTQVERFGQGIRMSQLRKQLQQLVTCLLELADLLAKEKFSTCTALYRFGTDRIELLTWAESLTQLSSASICEVQVIGQGRSLDRRPLNKEVEDRVTGAVIGRNSGTYRSRQILS